MKTALGILLILALGTVPAWAILGEDESSVSLDQGNIGGKIRAETYPGYRLHQITSPNGAVVKEYVSPEGKVFGISWQAPFMPNLQQLLGSYFTYVQEAAGLRRQRRGGPLVVRTNDFVFVGGGHMRSFHGHAYVSSLLPPNVSAEVVQ